MQIYDLKLNYKSLPIGSSNWKWEHYNSWQDVIDQKPYNVIRFNSSDLIFFFSVSGTPIRHLEIMAEPLYHWDDEV